MLSRPVSPRPTTPSQNRRSSSRPGSRQSHRPSTRPSSRQSTDSSVIFNFDEKFESIPTPKNLSIPHGNYGSTGLEDSRRQLDEALALASSSSQLSDHFARETLLEDEEMQGVRVESRNKYCTGIDLTTNLFTLLMCWNYVIEMTDCYNVVEGNFHLFPCPGDPKALALIPNNWITQAIFLFPVIITTIVWDRRFLKKGLEETIEHAKPILNKIICRLTEIFQTENIEIPDARQQARKLSKMGLFKLNAFCLYILLSSTIDEILNVLSMNSDNDIPDEHKRIGFWLQYITSCDLLNEITSYGGPIAFFLSEALAFQSFAKNLITSQRGPYPLFDELITLPFRVAGGIGNGLFALRAATNMLSGYIPGLNTPLGQILWLTYKSSCRAFTSIGYDGENNIQIMNEFFNTLRRMMHGEFPHPRAVFITLVALVLGGVPAYGYQRLAEFYFIPLASSFMQTYVLNPLANLWAIHMWQNFAGNFKAFGTFIANGCKDPQEEKINPTPDAGQGLAYNTLTDNEPTNPVPVSMGEQKEPESPGIYRRLTVKLLSCTGTISGKISSCASAVKNHFTNCLRKCGDSDDEPTTLAIATEAARKHREEARSSGSSHSSIRSQFSRASRGSIQSDENPDFVVASFRAPKQSARASNSNQTSPSKQSKRSSRSSATSTTSHHGQFNPRKTSSAAIPVPNGKQKGKNVLVMGAP